MAREARVREPDPACPGWNERLNQIEADQWSKIHPEHNDECNDSVGFLLDHVDNVEADLAERQARVDELEVYLKQAKTAAKVATQSMDRAHEGIDAAKSRVAELEQQRSELMAQLGRC